MAGRDEGENRFELLMVAAGRGVKILNCSLRTRFRDRESGTTKESPVTSIPVVLAEALLGVSRTELTFPSVALDSFSALGCRLCRNVVLSNEVLPNCNSFLSLGALKDNSRGADSVAGAPGRATDFDNLPRGGVLNGVFSSFTTVLGPCLPTA